MIWIAVTIQHSISVQHGTLLHCTIALYSLCSSFSYMSHSLPHTSWRTETLSCSSLRGPGVRMEAWERKKWNYSVLYVDSISVFHPTLTLSLSLTHSTSPSLYLTHTHTHTNALILSLSPTHTLPQIQERSIPDGQGSWCQDRACEHRESPPVLLIISFILFYSACLISSI